jgi:predicted transcriptional regulator
MFWFTSGKKEVKELRKEIHDSFNNVKRDFNKVGDWIKHIDGKQTSQEEELETLKNEIYSIQESLEEIKDFISFFGGKLSKQTQTVVDKQAVVEAVQTPVQTAVQTGFLGSLTVMERAIVWALLNTDMRLSYEDLAALLGKDKSTIRGQINALKKKNEGLIEEIRESTGKKRLYIPENMRKILLKSVKVKVNNEKRVKKA